MNGFASAILTMLLSWIRSLASRLWLLLSTQQDGGLVAVLRSHWKTVFVAFCIGGFLLDRAVYFIRWRPYYVWGTKLGRLKRRLRGEKPQQKGVSRPARPQPAPLAYQPPPSYRAPLPEEDEGSFSAPQPEGPYIQDDISGHTLGYAPLNAGYAAPKPQGSLPYSYEVKGAEFQPDFDGSTMTWASPLEEETCARNSPLYARDSILSADFSEEPIENLGENLSPGFGQVQSEPAQYLQDVQSGFAPPLSPEALYPPRISFDDEPVHPGLDLKTFQQNIGLTPPPDPVEAVLHEAPGLQSAANFPNSTFVSFYQNTEQGGAARSRNPFSGLAKKARSLVSIHDEDNPLSIRDLRPTVDIKNAFHSPVFPQNPEESGDND